MSINKLYILAFIEGALVMAFELIVARLMAPFFGSSLFTLTSVLGITMFALLAGYYLGGTFVQREFNPNRAFLFVVIAGSILSLLPAFGADILLLSVGIGLIPGAIISCFLLLGIPLILLGAVSPMLIQSLSEINLKAGKASGNVYAISTLGGVVNTFLIGLLLIPNIGVKMTAISYGLIGSIIVIALLISVKFSKKDLALFLIVGISNMTAYSMDYYNIPDSFKQIYESEGLLGRLDVVDDVNGFRALSNNGTNQTRISLKTGWSSLIYSHVVATAASMVLKENRNSVALLGLAGGTLVRELDELGYKDIFAIDIDKRTKYVSENYFNVNPESYKFIEDDGRHFFLESDKMFDLIIIDVSASEQQPSHLYTKQAFELYKKHLSPGGLLVLNIVDLVKLGKGIITDRIGDSLLEAGYNVKLVSEFYPPAIVKNTISEYVHEKIIIASNGIPSELSTDRYEMNECCRKYAFNLNLKEDFNNWTINKNSIRDKGFTDDIPEMELLNFERIKLIRK